MCACFVCMWRPAQGVPPASHPAGIGCSTPHDSNEVVKKMDGWMDGWFDYYVCRNVYNVPTRGQSFILCCCLYLCLRAKILMNKLW